MHKFLIIQTAFTGDVVLATALIEKLHQSFPDAHIDFLLRKGNEGLLEAHPYLNKLWIWDKKKSKTRNLLQLIGDIRSAKYTHVINPHRFASSGIIAAASGAPYIAGFNKNPLSFLFTKKVNHHLSDTKDATIIHETDRNQLLIADFTDTNAAMPALYPVKKDYDLVEPLQIQPYLCIAPSSVWFTKQFPAEKWIDLINVLPAHYKIYIIGAPSDAGTADNIIQSATNKNVQNLCGKLNFLQSAALMQGAVMNYTNDSAPLHFASAMNAPLTAVFCSTIPSFGFGPLRDNAHIVQIAEELYCRPCGLHGHKTCPEGHFRCALEITNNQLLWWISKTI